MKYIIFIINILIVNTFNFGAEKRTSIDDSFLYRDIKLKSFITPDKQLEIVFQKDYFMVKNQAGVTLWTSENPVIFIDISSDSKHIIVQTIQNDNDAEVTFFYCLNAQTGDIEKTMQANGAGSGFLSKMEFVPSANMVYGYLYQEATDSFTQVVETETRETGSLRKVFKSEAEIHFCKKCMMVEKDGFVFTYSHDLNLLKKQQGKLIGLNKNKTKGIVKKDNGQLILIEGDALKEERVVLKDDISAKKAFFSPDDLGLAVSFYKEAQNQEPVKQGIALLDLAHSKKTIFQGPTKAIFSGDSKTCFLYRNNIFYTYDVLEKALLTKEFKPECFIQNVSSNENGALLFLQMLYGYVDMGYFCSVSPEGIKQISAFKGGGIEAEAILWKGSLCGFRQGEKFNVFNAKQGTALLSISGNPALSLQNVFSFGSTGALNVGGESVLIYGDEKDQGSFKKRTALAKTVFQGKVF